MRLCYADGRLDLHYKGTLAARPPHTLAWFEVAERRNANEKIIFGHWAALEPEIKVPRIYPLDTGCIWGGHLTAMRLEDAKRFSIKCN
jgi:bis(5'-nucleosyl)-tetraphosphatase (symmetrical)